MFLPIFFSLRQYMQCFCVTLPVLAMLLSSAVAATPQASTITVTTTMLGVATDGQCSLTEAIINANADAKTAADCPAGSGADVIVLASGATYTLVAADNTTNGANGLPAVTSDITVNGNGATIQRSSAAGTPNFRIFHVGAKSALRLRNVTVANGVARGEDGYYPTDGAGGGIYSQGMLTAENSIVRDNTAVGGNGIDEDGQLFDGGFGFGGGIYSVRQPSSNVATTILTNTLISNNRALGGVGDSGGVAWGGGLYCGDNTTLTLNTSTLDGNLANGGNSHKESTSNQGGDGFGGGLFMESDSASRLVNITVRNNRAVGGDSTASADGWPGVGDGGGMYIYSSGFDTDAAELRGSSITNNEASRGKDSAGHTNAEFGSGGGIMIDSSGFLITASQIDGNRASDQGGGIAVRGGSLVYMTSSTISHNTAQQGGGVFIQSTYLDLVNSTVSGNTAARGGGIFNASDQGLAIVSNSTISSNTASDSGGGIFNDALNGHKGASYLWNSIVAKNAGGDCSQQGGSITTAGHNLASDGSCSLDAAQGDQPRADPRLGPLQDNGGPTWTHALLTGSPAIDRGNPAGCTYADNDKLLTADQRGAARPQGAACDIGAFEVGVLTTPRPHRVLLPLIRK